MGNPCRTFIVDDDDDMAFLTKATIEVANDGLMVAGVARSADEAIEQLRDANADVVVLDFRMPGRNGLEAAADMLAMDPNVNIVMFSAYLDAHTVSEAEHVGIRECVSKDRVSELPGILRKYCPAA